MSAFGLRMLATAFMLLDHIGALFGDLPFGVSTLLRVLGRISFPLFAFLIANGYRHTKNRPHYAMRLALFAYISEPFFDRCFHGSFFYLGAQNVFFTLTLGLLTLILFDFCRERGGYWRGIGCIAIAIPGMLAHFANTDYGVFGVALIFFLWITWESKLWQSLVLVVFSLRNLLLCCMNMLFGSALVPEPWDLVTLGAMGAILPIMLYNGKKGISPRNRGGAVCLKYGFYLFYPLHLLLLWILM